VAIQYPKPSLARVVALTVAAMLAFAGNSVLCRLALGQDLIDAASFATVRVASGAAVLALIVLPRRRSKAPESGSWRPVAALFAYMVCFSFAYLSLSAGTGALILFGAVQLTMILTALRAGEAFSPLSWLGFVVAVLGLVWLVLPGVTAPDPIGALLMTLAGIAWGAYSILGRISVDPLESTCRNFIRCVPLVLLVSVFSIGQFRSSMYGLLLAVSSGAVTSGLGYVAWYAALRGLTSMRAATVQLTVPALAAFGGVLWLSEGITPRLLLASAATLGGVGMVLAQRAARRV
jgi:drug/metabolite transporter (DMT)-like permease